MYKSEQQRRVMKKKLKCVIVVVLTLLFATLALAADLSTDTKSSLVKLELEEVWHKVKKGDNLYRIAINYGTTVENIKFYNIDARKRYIYPGQNFRIIVPIIHQKTVLRETKTIEKEGKENTTKSVASITRKVMKRKNVSDNTDDDSEPAKVITEVVNNTNTEKSSSKIMQPDENNIAKNNQKQFYIVKDGDVLGIISRDVGVPVKDLSLWNQIGKRSLIVVGQKLRITKPRFYSVVSGDSLGRISNKTGISVTMLKHFNKKLPRVIHPGDIIFLDKDVFVPYSLASEEKRIGTKRMKCYAQYIDLAYQETGVDRNLIAAVMKAESDFNPDANSNAGAFGLMQLMPDCASDMKVDRFNELQNVIGGARYLSYVNEMFNGSLDKTLAAYNAGPRPVIEHKGIPPYKETIKYVAKVKATYRISVRYMLES